MRGLEAREVNCPGLHLPQVHVQHPLPMDIGPIASDRRQPIITVLCASTMHKNCYGGNDAVVCVCKCHEEPPRRDQL